ncbi:MAG: hypothetical protein PVS3B1_37270 [Ktedonobacteraceae bacterium]
MDARFYNSEEIDTERLANDIVNVYLAQGYQAQQIGNKDQMLVQLKKGGDFEAIIGMQAAVSLTLQRTAGGLLAMIGQQRWVDKAAVGAVGIVAFPLLWPLALTAGAGALRQASLGNQVLNVVDGLVRQQRPGIQAGPIPMNIVPQIQQQWGQPPASQIPVYVPPAQIVGAQPPVQQALPVPSIVPADAPAQLHCPQCNTPYEPGDTFCTGCGRALTTPRQYCANCNTELKPGLAFCPRCGASTFNAVSAGAQQASPAPAPQAPAYQPPVQPAPQAPAYQPPAPPAYTPPTPQNPPVAPPTQVYYTATSQPQTADAHPAHPVEPYYVPPVTQEPAVKPQPKVTFTPGAPKQEPPPPQKPRPQKQYYIPSNQAQPEQQTLSAAEQPTVEDATMPATVAAQPAVQHATWGALIFADGGQIPLSGERAVVGRYDHDLGGVRPEVDLSNKQGADTVSRVHAALEHSGGNYMLTDLNSTNATRVNSKRLEPDKPTPINDGDALQFGKVQVTFKVS